MWGTKKLLIVEKLNSMKKLLIERSSISHQAPHLSSYTVLTATDAGISTVSRAPGSRTLGPVARLRRAVPSAVLDKGFQLSIRILTNVMLLTDGSRVKNTSQQRLHSSFGIRAYNAIISTHYIRISLYYYNLIVRSQWLSLLNGPPTGTVDNESPCQASGGDSVDSRQQATR